MIWHPGDSRLMHQHLTMPVPDAILFDFSDNEWHFGLAGAAKLANAYPNTPLLLAHWGTVDAPDFTPFNGDPANLAALVVNPERIRVLAPGEPYVLTRVKKAGSTARRHRAVSLKLPQAFPRGREGRCDCTVPVLYLILRL